MPYYTFNTNVPATDDDPGDDQPEMKTNNISLNGLLSVDHYPFNDAKGGYHKQCTMYNIGSATPPDPNNSGVLFAKSLGGDSWPFWKNNSGSAIALLSGIPKRATNGYTYLAGNILLQWGIVSSPSTGPNPVLFTTSNVDFSAAPYFIFLSPTETGGISSSSRVLAIVRFSTVSATGFTFLLQTTSATVDNVYWYAIGPGPT